ncbi:hypothetical protein LCI18_014713 [Fusarium solani-melongenae]|uniref:Uncharacterized protein n=1 Tax=Fusarium solani subsp. cucurbitae TaxID=2747967 RepID=A0ACD3ZR17_FUSSC|nr:hypothetical protein LCI18_014713 [Fusarium solani-melongenae]
MKLSTIAVAALAAAPISEVAAHPGMGDTIREIKRIAARTTWGSSNTQNNKWGSSGSSSNGGSSWPGQSQNNGGQNSWSSGGSQSSGGSSWPSSGGSSSGSSQSGNGWSGDSFNPNQLLGDLRTLSDSSLTRVGSDIKKILQGSGNPESRDRYFGVPPMNTPRCKRDTCCVWKYISDELHTLFQGDSGRCSKWARYAVRMGFHDAGTWSTKTAAQGGGADGSIILAGELSRGENLGLQDMGKKYQEVYTKYHDKLGFDQVTYADLIQMGANIAAVTCPLGPRVRSFVGRQDTKKANPNNLLPNVNGNALYLINLFKDKTIGPDDLVALIGAHTTSQQNHVNTDRAGDPQDSTPGVWDVLFYKETIGNAPDRVYKFQSDIALSKHPLTQPAFEAFAGGNGAQRAWNVDYARAYVRLSLLGVNNINDLTECTKVLPQPIDGYKHRDGSRFSKWLQSDDNSWDSKKISQEVENGYTISTPDNKIPTKRGPWRKWW